MRTQPEPGTRVRVDNRSGTVVAPDGRRAAAYRKEHGGNVFDQHHAYVQWDDSRDLCLVLLPILQGSTRRTAPSWRPADDRAAADQ